MSGNEKAENGIFVRETLCQARMEAGRQQFQDIKDSFKELKTQLVILISIAIPITSLIIGLITYIISHGATNVIQ